MGIWDLACQNTWLSLWQECYEIDFEQHRMRSFKRLIHGPMSSWQQASKYCKSKQSICRWDEQDVAMVADAITVPVHSAGDICTSLCVLVKLGRKKTASGGVSTPQTRGSRICGTLLSCFFVMVWLSSPQVFYESITPEYSKEKNYKIWRTSLVRQLRKSSRVRGRWDPSQVGRRKGSVHTKTDRGFLSRNITHSRLQTWDHLQSLA